MILRVCITASWTILLMEFVCAQGLTLPLEEFVLQDTSPQSEPIEASAGSFEFESLEFPSVPATETVESVMSPVSQSEDAQSDSNTTLSPIQHSFAELIPSESGQVTTIQTHVHRRDQSARLVRYDVPLTETVVHAEFLQRGIEGKLVEVAAPKRKKESFSTRVKAFLNPMRAQEKEQKVRVVRYEVPADDIVFHSQLVELDGQLLEPGMLRLPEVRFFQPKARIFSDLKSDNDDEFDLFSDGAILASLDVVELYFPMPLVSERFAEAFGKSSRLSALGWRVGGTLGVGLATALKNGDSDVASSPISTLSMGIRYEFPLGRPSRELLETGDARLDQRTRVGIESGLQGGFSTRESLSDRTDLGVYFGIVVDTPWGG